MNRYDTESRRAFVDAIVKQWMRDVDELREENDRLRGLLMACQPYVEGGPICDSVWELCEKIKSEVSDE